jgi:hypothetical protein
VTPVFVELQDRTKGACSFGGWMKPDRWSYGFGPVYTTAMSVLCLESCYRSRGARRTRARAASLV